MNESDHCECPVPCKKIRYQPQLSYAQMPAKHYSEALAKLKHIDKDRMRHFLRWDPLIEFNVWQNADDHHFFFFFETFFLILRVSLKDVLQQNGFLVSKICLFSKLLTRWFINLLFHLFVLSTLVDLVQLYEKQYSNWIRSSWKWEFSVLASNWSALFYHSPLLCHFIKNTTI